jgi:hypothetical protein
MTTSAVSLMLPPIRTYRINLPFPVSVNRIWRHTSGLTHSRAGSILTLPKMLRSVDYRHWIEEANEMWMTQRRQHLPLQTLGHYHAHMIFDQRQRRGRDGDNLIKCVSDWLQLAALVHNDREADGGSWTWGEVDGCVVEVTGVPRPIRDSPDDQPAR